MESILEGKKLNEEETVSLMDTMLNPTTPEKILVLIKGFNRNLLDPDIVMVEGIKNANKKEDLIPICLALRYGANANLYVQVPEIGKIHILGFCYLTLDPNYNCKDSKNCTDCVETKTQNIILNSIIVTLKIAGSNWESPVFQNNEKVVEIETNEAIMDINIFNPICGKSINRWLKENYVDSIIPFKMSEVKPDTLNAISIYLDMNEYLCKTPNIEQIVAAHSDKVFNNYIKNNKSWSKNVVSLGIKYLNLTAFEKAIDEGEELKFYQVSTILALMKERKESDDLVSYSQLLGMLLYSVDNGTYIDEKHFQFLNELDMDSASELKTRYEVPMWKKYCKNCKGEIPYRLKKLAYRLNILDSSNKYLKKDICEIIQKIRNANREEVKKAVIKRQETRITATLSSYLSYIENEPSIVIRNRSLLNNVYDYPDNDIVFYKDVNNTSWLFTRNYFKQLSESGKNPYTNLPLPVLLIDEMVKRGEYYDSVFGDEDYNIIPISKVLDSLDLPDSINDEYSKDKILKLKIKWGEENIYPALTNEEIESILEATVKDEVYTEGLSEDLINSTFAVTIMESSSQNIEEVIQNLKLSQKIKTETNPLLLEYEKN